MLSMPLSNTLSSAPLSYYSIPAVWLTAFAPVLIRTTFIYLLHGDYNNVAPRKNMGEVAANKSLSPAQIALIQRMEGAHINGNENLPIWIAAVIVGNLVGLDHALLNTVSLYYVVGRILYNYIYISQRTVFQSWVRSTVYFACLAMPLYILIQAGTKATKGF